MNILLNWIQPISKFCIEFLIEFVRKIIFNHLLNWSLTKYLYWLNQYLFLILNWINQILNWIVDIVEMYPQNYLYYCTIYSQNKKFWTWMQFLDFFWTISAVWSRSSRSSSSSRPTCSCPLCTRGVRAASSLPASSSTRPTDKRARRSRSLSYKINHNIDQTYGLFILLTWWSLSSYSWWWPTWRYKRVQQRSSLPPCDGFPLLPLIAALAWFVGF